jgi:hypothetical protein
MIAALSKQYQQRQNIRVVGEHRASTNEMRKLGFGMVLQGGI